MSESSHGNTLGVGLADVTTATLTTKIDWKATNQNVITSGFLQRGFLPIVAENDQKAIGYAIQSCGIPVTDDFRLVWIRDTLHLDEIYVSQSLWKELEQGNLGEKISDFISISFDETGQIMRF